MRGFERQQSAVLEGCEVFAECVLLRTESFTHNGYVPSRRLCVLLLVMWLVSASSEQEKHMNSIAVSARHVNARQRPCCGAGHPCHC